MVCAAVPAEASAKGSGCGNTRVAATATSEAHVRAAVRCLVNERRAAHGLRRLEPSARLRLAADRHDADMVARHYFGHVSPEGRTMADRVRATGYLAGAHDWSLGEDIGWGTASLSTPAAIVRAWMHSPPHRRVILEAEYRDVGVGVARGVPIPGQPGGATFVLDLGAAR